ncbi:hypothetical protein BDZ94DRAFT_1165108 [Collybia nuda]|uniref:Nephrocystin 3-like N-terminal domain-containing protein n=1 Tax=Collybia nuda TaxID=64659 RepID=A0A9P5Y3G3_9AGAR|nr:hypothetical protein BDZ94DRAFT_1165108 [Collybia nuda]
MPSINCCVGLIRVPKIIVAKSDLDDLIYAAGASCSPEKNCLPGTRQSIIDEIVNWAHQPQDNPSCQLLWLYGVAGSGKSAIAHTVAHRFDACQRLGSSFCFDANQATRGPEHLFSTISRDLADFDNVWRISLSNAVKGKKSIRGTHSVVLQFENFLVRPAENLDIVGPVVIVIDALDECGDANSRKFILEILETRLSELPGNFRIIVTSRPEPDIRKRLWSHPHILCKDMADIGMSRSIKDVEIFIQRELGTAETSLSEHFPDWCAILAKKSDGLFQWAFTACSFIKQQGRLPHEYFDVIVKGSEGGDSQLDNLYSQILHHSLLYQDATVLERFQTILGIVLTVKKPLLMSTLGALCLEHNMDIVKSILMPLGAVLHGVTSESVPIYTLHTSFRDFLMNENRSGIFHVEAKKANKNVTSGCLASMLNKLQFNICQLQTSCELNQDVVDMEKRIKDHIPDDLSYACTFWAEHLEDSDYAGQAEVNKFLNTKLLSWLEVLSVMGLTKSAMGSLQKLYRWTNVRCTWIKT